VSDAITEMTTSEALVAVETCACSIENLGMHLQSENRAIIQQTGDNFVCMQASEAICLDTGYWHFSAKLRGCSVILLAALFALK